MDEETRTSHAGKKTAVKDHSMPGGLNESGSKISKFRKGVGTLGTRFQKMKLRKRPLLRDEHHTPLEVARLLKSLHPLLKNILRSRINFPLPRKKIAYLLMTLVLYLRRISRLAMILTCRLLDTARAAEIMRSGYFVSTPPVERMQS